MLGAQTSPPSEMTLSAADIHRALDVFGGLPVGEVEPEGPIPAEADLKVRPT
jgi:hypothetical protein